MARRRSFGIAEDNAFGREFPMKDLNNFWTMMSATLNIRVNARDGWSPKNLPNAKFDESRSESKQVAEENINFRFGKL